MRKIYISPTLRSVQLVTGSFLLSASKVHDKPFYFYDDVFEFEEEDI